MISVHLDVGSLKRTRWYEYAVRFLFGGAITVVTGILVKRYGPVFGGLFLAFPAIFPASATLVQKHETQKKTRAGIKRGSRGRLAAALDARGAMLGGVGLIFFALVVWFLITKSAVLGLGVALLVWLAVSVTLWLLHRSGFGRAAKPHARN